MSIDVTALATSDRSNAPLRYKQDGGQLRFIDGNLRPCKHVHSHQFTHFYRIKLIIIIHFWNWRVLSKTTRFDAPIKTKLPSDPRLCSFKSPEIDSWGEG